MGKILDWEWKKKGNVRCLDARGEKVWKINGKGSCLEKEK